VTTGEGRFYSNGIDVDWLVAQGKDTNEKYFTVLLDTMWRVMHFPLPTVAAINGKYGGIYMI
jgi:enoyl-CoA hydratase/carnithine racemase